MTSRLINSIKAVVVFCFVLFSIIACEKDFENIGVNIVDNNFFSTKDTAFNLIANTKNVEFSRVDNLPRYILGVYQDDNFGKLEASFLTQLGFSGSIDFGLDPVIDTVIVNIPYYATQEEESFSNNVPKFRIDSVYGNVENTYQLKVHRLNSFLNTLDPQDPSMNKRYYSNESYELGDLLANYDNFKPEAIDTVLYVKRHLLNDTDTIKSTPLAPSLKLALDEEIIRDIFINNASESDLETIQNFNNYFRGIMIQAIENSTEGSIVALNTSGGSLTIYYTNTVLTDETTTDLNGDGDTDDNDVPVLTKQTLELPFLGVEASTYIRDYNGSEILNEFENPNPEEGKSELFVQGAGGSLVEIDLFKDVDLEELRSKNWLINGAILDVYVKEGQLDIPNRLYLYNLNNNSVITDAATEAQIAGIDGNIDLDEDGKPVKYQFLITDYISEILKYGGDHRELGTLAMKVYHSTDFVLSPLDTIVRNYSWNPRGVILYGSKESEDTAIEAKRMKLTIYYTEDSGN